MQNKLTYAERRDIELVERVKALPHHFAGAGK